MVLVVAQLTAPAAPFADPLDETRLVSTLDGPVTAARAQQLSLWEKKRDTVSLGLCPAGDREVDGHRNPDLSRSIQVTSPAWRHHGLLQRPGLHRAYHRNQAALLS